MTAAGVMTGLTAAGDRIDPRDKRIDVRAKFALARMRDQKPDIRPDAIRLIRALNAGRLAGIYGDDLAVAARLASRFKTVRWKLVSNGEDAALILDGTNPLRGPPTIIFRGDTPSKIPGRIDRALSRISRVFALWQAGLLRRCDSQSLSTTPLATVAPSGFCYVQRQSQTGTSVQLTPHPLLYYVWSRPFAPKGPAQVAQFGDAGRSADLNPDDCINFDDNRSAVSASLTAPFRFVCSIGAEFKDGGGKTATGTGTLISPRHVLTSAHVASMLTLRGNSGWEIGNNASRILVVPGRNHAAASRTNRHPRGILEVQDITLCERFQDARCNGRLIPDAELIQFDYALLTLKASVNPLTYGFWGTSNTIMREIKANEIVNVSFRLSGYPGDKCGLVPTAGSATATMLRDCFARTSPPACGPDILCQMLSDVASVQWQTPGTVLSSPPSNFSAPLAFSLEASVCGGMSGSPIWVQRQGKQLMIGIWSAFLPRLPIACGTRIHATMISELRAAMRRDAVEPKF